MLIQAKCNWEFRKVKAAAGVSSIKARSGGRETDAERFDIGVREIVGKRLTCSELTGKSEDPPQN